MAWTTTCAPTFLGPAEIPAGISADGAEVHGEPAIARGIAIQARVNMQHKTPGGIGGYHVRVSTIVPALGKAARWSVGRPGRANRAGIALNKARDKTEILNSTYRIYRWRVQAPRDK